MGDLKKKMVMLIYVALKCTYIFLNVFEEVSYALMQ